jgi:hypothetical protein
MKPIQQAELEGQIIILTEENKTLREYVDALKARLRSMIATNTKEIESGFD